MAPPDTRSFPPDTVPRRDIESSGFGPPLNLACLDDAQGQKIEIVRELEFAPQILDSETLHSIGWRVFDLPRHFAAYAHASDPH